MRFACQSNKLIPECISSPPPTTNDSHISRSSQIGYRYCKSQQASNQKLPDNNYFHGYHEQCSISNSTPITDKPYLSISHYENLPIQPFNDTFIYNKNLQRYLTGRQLLLDEIPFTIEEIHIHYENGLIRYCHGVYMEEKMYVCGRCGNREEHLFATFPCARCREQCTYCRMCIMMGRVSTCTPLIRWIGPPPTWEIPQQPLAWDGQLSPGQQVASERIIAIIHEVVSASRINSLLATSTTNEPISTGQNNTQNHRFSSTSNRRLFTSLKNNLVSTFFPHLFQPNMNNQHQHEMLVWAVCGAGKTELLFAGISEALKKGMRVCIATPRTDVVLELAPRLQAAFPKIKIAALYGGSEDRHTFAPLTIATTHQLFRFWAAFDVVILDEVDAFPYSADETLQHAVQQARKAKSALIYLTATPSEQWQRECQIGKRAFVTIPARYHRHKLPVPKFVWCGNWQKLLQVNKLPNSIREWVEKRVSLNKQALLFFPRIELLDQMLLILRSVHPEIQSVHAADPHRKEKVQLMRDKIIPMLLTTTILERGVTFPNIDVAVIGAEDDIFTESALVQIAGRVGRSAQFPDGVITFFHFGKTEAMVRARQQIINMNREAMERGLLDE